MTTVRLPYPDTDYPPGHPERKWGTLTTEKEKAEQFIIGELARNKITKSEQECILGILHAQVSKDIEK